MATKRNDAQAQQTVDHRHKKAASKLALRVLIASETHIVAAGFKSDPVVILEKPTAE